MNDELEELGDFRLKFALGHNKIIMAKIGIFCRRAEQGLPPPKKAATD
jgi:hypothetical protein